MDAGILFVGNTTYDTLGTLQHDITTSGMNTLTFVEQCFGGKAANAAVACASSGIEAAYIGTVGTDFVSIGYQDYLKQSHVDSSDVFSLAQITPRFFAFHSETEEYWFVTHMQEARDQHHQFQQHLRSVLSKRSAQGIYCALAREETVLDAFENAKLSGKQTAWNPINRFPERELVEQILRKTDILFVNERELESLEQSLTLSSPHFFTVYGVQIICITCGAKGCQVIEKGTVTNVPTMQVDVVTTVGAGDAFAGTFLASYQRFGSPLLCAELACIAGSLLVQSPRDRPQRPTFDELLLLRSSIR